MYWTCSRDGKAGEVGDPSDGSSCVDGQDPHEGLEEGVLVDDDWAIVGEGDDGPSASCLWEAYSQAV